MYSINDMSLADTHQRQFTYLRLSVTERCNFRCVYCLPNGYRISDSQESELSIDEIRRIVIGFSKLGIRKIRLTGGEPTLRRDLVEIVRTIASVPGIQKIAITTNGHRLEELALPLREAGVTSINISIDSLIPERFHRITGTNNLQRILNGIEYALTLRFESIKVNAVLLQNINHDEFPLFLDWIKERPISVRFIELMRTGKNKALFDERHVSGNIVRQELSHLGWKPVPRRTEDGPAAVYEHPSFVGTLGIISPYSPNFCQSCNRLRISSRGVLRLCLFGDKDASLRPYLSSDHQEQELIHEIQRLVLDKPPSHLLHQGNYGNTWNLSAIGG